VTRLTIIIAGMLLVCFSQVGAKPAIIDWNQKPESFSNEQYQKMLACSLEKHGDYAKRYSEYHLNRRDVQTPEQNVRDPDSELMMPALVGCVTLKNGPIPFSLDKLIRDWYFASHQVGSVHTSTMEGFAACLWKRNPAFVKAALADRAKGDETMVLVGGMRVCPVEASTLSFNHGDVWNALAKAKPSLPVKK
jgi:hypothetical protein